MNTKSPDMNIKNVDKKRYVKSEETGKRIRRAALELIDELGFENVTIQKICKACHVSVGTFYNYYDSKDQLLYDASRRMDDLFEKNVKQHLTEADPEQYIRKYFEYYAKMNEEIGTDLYMRTYGKKNYDIRKEAVRPMYVILEDYIREKQGKGEIKACVHPSIIVRQLYVAARGTIMDWCLVNGNYNLNDEVQNILTPIIGYYVCDSHSGEGTQKGE